MFFPEWFGGPRVPMPERYGSDRDGWLLDYRVVAADALVRAPQSMTFEESATLPGAGVTAWSALAGVGPGDSVLVQGTGGVSLFALQLARILGARVIATTSRPANEVRLKELGAIAVVDYLANPEWSTIVGELTGGRGVDRIVDVGGPGTLAESINALAYGGQVAVVGALASDPVPFGFWNLFIHQATLRCISVGSRADLEALVRVVDAHSLHPVIDRVFEFDDAKTAFAHYFEGAPVGKVVIRH
jgi:alcohol dehydrogenase